MLLLAQKTSQVALHMSVAFAVMYVFTGSMAMGGVAAVVEPICNVLLLPLHDRFWNRLRSSMQAEKAAEPQQGLRAVTAAAPVRVLRPACNGHFGNAGAGHAEAA